MKWVKFTFFPDELQVHKQPALVRNMLGSYQGSRRFTNGKYLKIFPCLAEQEDLLIITQTLTVGHLIVSQRRFMSQYLSVVVFTQKRLQNPVKHLR